MNNQNIQIGIDLGTTNSEVAINNKNNIEIIKNVFGDEYTPSVFGIDKVKNKAVGKRAYERLYKDGSEAEFKNNKAEVKRLMGTSETVHLERLNQDFTPEQISAEILKSLREDILRKYPEFSTMAAVITIPAAFAIVQAEATKRAGNLAGFEHVVLLQEPIAAAVAYGFGNAKNENWLIYDLGGGTFDVALISSKDGVLSVLGHNGDNFLGGKNIDLEIVDKVIVPQILAQFSLADFNRNNKQYRNIFTKLKYIAETVKIYLSQYKKYSIEIDGIGNDDNGKEIYLSIDFSRKEFETLIQPIIDRTIELAKETLRDTGINNSSVSKIILVGGPTQMPYVRERLESALKISVDSSVDPLTVVARGACIFAISQKLPTALLESNSQAVKHGAQALSLNHETLTSETEETVTGIIESFKDSDSECYIQIQSDSGFYSGSKIRLRNGKFFDTVALEANRANLFWIYLFDKHGSSIPANPDSFTITHGLSVLGAPIPHSIGIAVAKKDFKERFTLTEVFETFFEKGSILPLKKTDAFKTARRLSKNENDNPLWIKVGEGESDIPDRNTFVCELGVKGKDLPYDLPEGTDIEITIEVNESRELFVTAYIPLIDLSLNARSTFRDEVINVQDIEADLKVQIDRTKTILENCSPAEQSKLDDTITSVSASLKNARLDEDEKRKANKQLKDLKTSLDQLETEKEMPQLVNEFTANIKSVKEIIDEYADEKSRDMDRDHLNTMKAEGEKAISENDKPLLIRINEQINELGAKAWYSNPSAWVYRFQKITTSSGNFLNEKEAKYYTEKGKRAIELGDLDLPPENWAS